MPMFYALLTEQDLPRRLASLPEGERILTDLMQLAELVQEADLEHHGMDDVLGWFREQVMLDIPGAFIFDIYARYYKFNFEKGSEIFEFDDQSLFVSMIRVKVFAGFFLSGKFWRVWQYDTEVGKFEPVDNWSAGGGWAITF